MQDTREARTLRLPRDVWERVREQAAANGRSCTREIEFVLRAHVTAEPHDSPNYPPVTNATQTSVKLNDIHTAPLVKVQAEPTPRKGS